MIRELTGFWRRVLCGGWVECDPVAGYFKPL
jgi:hypothetical protein